MAALEDLYKACPKYFYTKYTHDKDGRVVVGHDQIYAPTDYMSKSKEGMTTFLAAEQFRMNMGAVDLEEARRGFCIVGISNDLFGSPSFFKYAARDCKAILPKKIAERIKFSTRLPELEKHMQTKETIPNTNVLEWAKARHAKYLETLDMLTIKDGPVTLFEIL
ncbi:hypothetical protein SEMRO_516_G158600.1 [Seminavis robusta]|uniref:Uncharacterized protein n=1 Tax=Seminavis robusta TaxID=568900 RepID=A0A9N8E3U9_9STRA|nr:hypothetical protein SEMRO_516_G158600.1 [Seminavis robusta]|eukprot:Sro516_g158600.1 n/a (164) ;mRNA; f:59738-60324